MTSPPNAAVRRFPRPCRLGLVLVAGCNDKTKLPPGPVPVLVCRAACVSKKQHRDAFPSPPHAARLRRGWHRAPPAPTVTGIQHKGRRRCCCSGQFTPGVAGPRCHEPEEQAPQEQLPCSEHACSDGGEEGGEHTQRLGQQPERRSAHRPTGNPRALPRLPVRSPCLRASWIYRTPQTPDATTKMRIN